MKPSVITLPTPSMCQRLPDSTNGYAPPPRTRFTRSRVPIAASGATMYEIAGTTKFSVMIA